MGPPNHPQYPHAQYPGPHRPPPRRRSLLWLWIALGCVGLVGACCIFAAFLPLVEEGSEEAATGSTAEAVEEKAPHGVRLRIDVPPGAARAIKEARDAIAVGDRRALQDVLADEGDFQLDDELKATTAKAAVEHWTDMLHEIDGALAGRCEVDPPDEDGHEMVVCGDREEPGDVFVIFSNMTDLSLSRTRFRITSVSSVAKDW